jgi:hypoxanthine phosphoribosyltransferase
VIDSSYLQGAFSAQYRTAVGKFFRQMVREVAFDTIVVTGTSGTLFGPLLAHIGRKRLVLVRKVGDGSHSSRVIEGQVNNGDKLVFVDDFVSSGETARRVNSEMLHRWNDGEWKWAGAFFWNSDPNFGFAEQQNAEWLERIPSYHFIASTNIFTGEIDHVNKFIRKPLV